MNYYERYCGDYAKKTARLTLMQHGAYTLLLDEYYSTEQPLPASLDELYRICRAMTKPEQEAVRFVAEKFFPAASDGLRRNDRADEVIEKARPRMEAARKNGKKGGRPPKNQDETHEKPIGFADDNPVKTHEESSPTPTPVNASGITKTVAARGSRLSKEWQPSDEMVMFCKRERPDLDWRRVSDEFRDYWVAKPGKDGLKLDWDGTWRNWVRRARQSPKQTAGGYYEKAEATIAALTGRDRDHDSLERIIDV